MEVTTANDQYNLRITADGKREDGARYWPQYPYEPDLCLYDELDPGIREFVRVLRTAGVETYESCEGGEGHAYTEPTIRFHGQQDEGWRALSVALAHALPISKLARIWIITEGEPIGAQWEMTFYKKADTDEVEEAFLDSLEEYPEYEAYFCPKCGDHYATHNSDGSCVTEENACPDEVEEGRAEDAKFV